MGDDLAGIGLFFPILFRDSITIFVDIPFRNYTIVLLAIVASRQGKSKETKECKEFNFHK
jgi:hypothetical protein